MERDPVHLAGRDIIILGLDDAGDGARLAAIGLT
jgi:hypothetical protein